MNRNLMESIILREEQVVKTIDCEQLENDIVGAVKQYFIDFDKDNFKSFSMWKHVIGFHVYLDDMLPEPNCTEITVTFELPYDETDYLLYRYLNPVIQQYDSSAFFNPESSTKFRAYLDNTLLEHKKPFKESIVNESTSSLNVSELAEDVKDTVKQFLSSKFNPLYNNIDSYYKVKVREPYGDSSDADVIEVTLTKQYFNEFSNSVIENITDTLNELLEKKYNAKYVFFETESDKKTLAYIWK